MFSAVFVIDSILYYEYGGKRYAITGSCRVVVSDYDDEMSMFRLIDEGDVLVRYFYPIPEEVVNTMPFLYLEPEDRIWEGFIATLVNDKERQYAFMEVMMYGRSGAG